MQIWLHLQENPDSVILAGATAATAWMLLLIGVCGTPPIANCAETLSYCSARPVRMRPSLSSAHTQRLLAPSLPLQRAFRPARRDQLRWRRPAAQQQAQEAPTSPAARSVEQGLQLFGEGKYEEALPLFLMAQQQQPNEDEARAALYNAACAHTKLRQWQAAADAVVAVVNDYDLKLSVAIKDPDLEALRERREWTEALSKVKGGMTEEQYVKLRSEAKAPFRLTRMYIFGALAGGAGLGLVIISTKLIAALQGQGDLQETLVNFGINAAAVAVFGYLLYRDYTKLEADKRTTEREEALAKLQVSLGPDRVLPLASFRGTTRPVIVVGNRGQVNKALAKAEFYREELRERGVSIVPVIVSDDDPQERLRKLKEELSGVPVEGNVQLVEKDKGKGFGASAQPKPAPAAQLTKKDKRWQLEPANIPEWAAWVNAQTKAANVAEGNGIYVQVQLDGSVRASGVGIPPWKQLVKDLPEISSVRTKLSDGMGA